MTPTCAESSDHPEVQSWNLQACTLLKPHPETDYFHLPGNETVVAVVDESTAVCARHAAGVQLLTLSRNHCLCRTSTPSLNHCFAACKARGELPPEPQPHAHRACYMCKCPSSCWVGHVNVPEASLLSLRSNLATGQVFFFFPTNVARDRNERIPAKRNPR